MLGSFIFDLTRVVGEQAAAASISALLSTLGTLLVSYLLYRNMLSKAQMQASADYMEKTEQVLKTTGVQMAEIFGKIAGKSGADKLLFAEQLVCSGLDAAEGALASQGIKGDPNSVDIQRLKSDLSNLAGQLFPKQPPAPPASPADKAA